MKKILCQPCFRDQIRSYGKRLPREQIFDIFASGGNLHSRLQLSRDNGVKLGKNLQTQTAIAGLPEIGDPLGGSHLLVSLRCVPGIDEHIGIDENATVHEFLPAWDSSCRACSADEASSRDNVAWKDDRTARSSFSPGAFLLPIWKCSCPARRPLFLPIGPLLHPW
jgi:hypothetical protein